MKKTRSRQGRFAFNDWGGKRPGAGRKPKGEKAGVSHGKREKISERFPLHVTLRVLEGLPSLRRRENHREILRAFGAGAERFGFRLLHYSVRPDHVHLIAEAKHERALARGMQGLSIRMARRLNRLWERSGSVFADRFHVQVLKTSEQVRDALACVLLDSSHHGSHVVGPDPCSSGAHFDGWKNDAALRARASRNGASLAAESSPPFLAQARSWLLRVGWRRHGLLSLQHRARRSPESNGSPRRPVLSA